MNYREWEQRVPVEIKGDSVWKLEAYRLALMPDQRGQLLREVASPYAVTLASLAFERVENFDELLETVPMP